MDTQIELAVFKTKVNAVVEYLETRLKMGPTSRKETEIVRGMMDDVQALGEKAIKRRRLK